MGHVNRYLQIKKTHFLSINLAKRIPICCEFYKYVNSFQFCTRKSWLFVCFSTFSTNMCTLLYILYYSFIFKETLICNPVIGFSTNNPNNLFLRFVNLFGELFTSSSAIVPINFSLFQKCAKWNNKISYSGMFRMISIAYK